jgi:putative ATPase
MDPLFPPADQTGKPLADRMRPQSLDEFVGQENIVGPGTLLRKSLEQGRLQQSLILWGPPGCGKTTLARIIAAGVKGRFFFFSAVTSGIAEVRKVIAEAKKLRSIENNPFILFVDEIHRFNKAQQDAFLPHIEDGTIVFIGATTENPSFEVIGPLLSRSRVLVLSELSNAQVMSILQRAIYDPDRGLGRTGIEVEDDVLSYVAGAARGDARVGLNALDYSASILVNMEKKVLTRDLAEQALQQPLVYTDKDGESHFNLISAMHKSLRGGDVDASLYWLARMCEAGEDPKYIIRRLIVFASEDVGNADPQALVIAIAAKNAVEFVGYPECKLALSQVVIYLALAPKSNTAYVAYGRAARAVHEHPPHPVPLHIRNAPTSLMKDLGHGKGYKYPHDFPDAFVLQLYLPEDLKGERFYAPKESGFEKTLKLRLEEYLAKRRNKKDER